MRTNDCIAMILAGGRGERLGALTRFYAKPAVHFGNHRIIDFALDNCMRSGIQSVGILSQYFADDLNAYIRAAYSDERANGRLVMLPPRGRTKYVATADAVYKNIAFIDQFQPKNVLILAGDHIYKMDYKELIEFHEAKGADVTVASTKVPLQKASRFGILSAYANGQVYDFKEKPANPMSSLASMGVYVFRWEKLKDYLIRDSEDADSHHDFGKDMIPAMLSCKESIFTYRFNGYWRDVGTLDSLWEANMDQLSNIFGNRIGGGVADFMDLTSQFHPVFEQASRSVISDGCSIIGKVTHSVLANSVRVDKGAEVIDSVIMPDVYIGENARIYRTIVGTGARIMSHTQLGADTGLDAFVDQKLCREDVSLVAPHVTVPEGMQFQKNSQICRELIQFRGKALYAMAISDYPLSYPAISECYGT